MIVKLRNVRLSYGALFEPKSFDEGGEKKFGATFLIPKEDPQIKELEAAIMTVATEKWKDKAKAVLKSISGNPNKFCLGDGDNKANLDGYADNMYIGAKNKKRPKVVNRDRTPIVKEDQKIDDGDYVIAHIELWAQDNQWGKGIRASLLGVQFYRTGDRLGGGGRVAADDDFEDLSDGAFSDDEDDLA